jgi:diguanylate cyclase (GGDEF)-like protein
VHEDDRERTIAKLDAAKSSRETSNSEFRIVWPNGQVRHLRAVRSTIFAPDGGAQRMFGAHWDITELRDLAEQLQRESSAAKYAAAHDQLTGLANRRGLEDWLSARSQLAGTLLYVDIDRFKSVNDRFGHDVGDNTLRLVGRIIADTVRECDIAARLGGDEFLLVLSDVCDAEMTSSIISRITSAVESLHPHTVVRLSTDRSLDWCWSTESGGTVP